MKDLNKIVNGLLEDNIQISFELNDCSHDELIQIIKMLMVEYKNLYVMASIERINTSMTNGEFDKILDNIITQSNNEKLHPNERKLYQDFISLFSKKKQCPPRHRPEPFRLTT